ncbi:MAG: glycosyltransferase family 4 protein [Methylacidiphilales bacterium]|nr:glycosyltransferase family 4 protein [Candidatus Methylacidiphilales bacterium]
MAFPAYANRQSNPFNSLLYGPMEQRGIEVVEYAPRQMFWERADIVHVHWPETSINMPSGRKALWHGAKTLLLLGLTRLRGARLIWTAHNLRSHENRHPILEKLFWWVFDQQIDGIISLSRANLPLVRREHIFRRKVPMTVIRHGHFRDAYPGQVTRSEARRHLGLVDSGWRLGCVGVIRRYKGIPELLGAWREFDLPEAHLLVAGRIHEPLLEQEIRSGAAQDGRIEFRPGMIDEKEMPYFISALDVMVLPYRAIFNSGSALLALSFNVPVVLPKTAGMLELQEMVGSDWVYLYEGDFGPAVLHDIRAWYQNRKPAGEVSLADLNWDILAEQTISFYLEVMQKKATSFESMAEPVTDRQSA